MSGTKKVGSAGRFGVRYGRSIRHKVAEIEKKLRSKQLCPYCHNYKVKRLAAGIWQCKKCGVKFTGKAYSID
ncbi:MAG TPA: 50S ribosomal protein L37ae [Candidatus Nanoarchaeia archaeon]|nr:50S ribosomal protein L37ae [Candidatus Nanoarchaeia archaeon]